MYMPMGQAFLNLKFCSEFRLILYSKSPLYVSMLRDRLGHFSVAHTNAHSAKHH